MTNSPLSRFRPLLILGSIIVVILIIWQIEYLEVWNHVADWRNLSTNELTPIIEAEHNLTGWNFDVEKDGRNFGLSDVQCDVAFPSLYQELDRATAWHRENKHQGKISETDIDQYDGRAQMRLMIHNGHLRLLDRWGTEGPHIPDRPIATIQAIHRAISSVPNPRLLPNIEFTIDTHDDSLNGGPKGTLWSYCRHKDNNATWVMPDFGFWSYPSGTVGSYSEFRSKVNATEEIGGFPVKQKKLVWRGAEGKGGDIRDSLVEASRGRPWSNVKYLLWNDHSSSLDMHQHCRYQFAAHTEGITWSGRLRYLQNCNNVVVTHKLEYIAHYYPLLITSGPDQNIVEVERGFGNLDRTMQDLLTDTANSERIARNGKNVFRDRYLTPAAEACYWRRMFRSWRKVQGFEPRLWTDGRKGEEGEKRWRGISWEQYSATGKEWGQDAPP